MRPDAAKAFLTRHLEFFNTNPTMATYVIGAVAAGELDAEEVGGETVADVKRSLSGPLGMAGDALLWGSLRPLAGLSGVAVALLGHAWAAVALLVLYNVPGRTGVDIPLIFEIEGEAGFRKREKAVIDELTRLPGIVLATGGAGKIPTDKKEVYSLLFDAIRLVPVREAHVEWRDVDPAGFVVEEGVDLRHQSHDDFPGRIQAL